MKLHKQTSQTVFTLMVGLFCLVTPRSGLAAESPDRVLTTAAAVRSLSAAEAERHYPVKLHGVVTFYDEALLSRFVQDETAGIYLWELTNMPPLQAGQEVEVEGVTGPGEYAPVVMVKSVKVLGTSKLPTAEPVSLAQLVSGREDSQLVEFSGIVRAVHFEKDSQYFLIDFVVGGERFTVYTKQLPVAQAQDLVDSTVKVRGVCSTMFNHQRQMFGIHLLVPQADGLVVEKTASASPYDLPVQKLNSLLQFTPEGNFGGRVKVTGTVVYSEPGSALFIQDPAAGLYCQTLQRDLLQPGDQVEILGFPAKGEYTPILEDAIYRKVGAGSEPKPDAVDVNEVLTGFHDCRLVQLQAKVLDCVQRGVNQFLLLQSGDFTFQAYLPQKVNANDLATLPNGSEVTVTGICLIERGNNWQAGEKWRAASFHLLLRSPKDVVVLQAPAGWTWPDETWVMGGLALIALGALAWVAVLKIKIRQQTTTKI
ncbi:MAG: hypothetical protein WCS42_09260 [Verrucomicrobiota bacterium]